MRNSSVKPTSLPKSTASIKADQFLTTVALACKLSYGCELFW